MIWKNAELYNISELESVGYDDGFAMRRVPQRVEEYLSESGRRMNHAACGAEIRFVIKSGEVRIKMSVGEEDAVSCARLPLFYGNIGAGWQDCLKNVYNTPTEIIIPAHPKQTLLEKISGMAAHPFSPRVVRLSLQNRAFRIYDIKGDIEPPKPEDVPEKRYLAYGSSITHGSLALLQCNTWTARVAENTKSDLINLGFAGSACLEPEMADYIANRTDFDFATLEMGINILGIDPEDFRNRVRYFVSTVASSHPESKVFCIDVFRCEDDLNGGARASAFRRIVGEVLSELKLSNTVHIDGMKMLTSFGLLSGDLVHPSARGVEEMARNIADVILSNI